jgi:TPR repeat protein
LFFFASFLSFCSFFTTRSFFFQDLEKKLEIVTKENSKLKKLAKSQVENIIEPAATKKGDVGAIQVMGECYEFGLGGKKKDEKTAIENYEKGVMAENPASQFSLGKILLEQSKNDVKASERAVSLLKKSTASDYTEAQFELGYRLLWGSKVPKDSDAALDLFRKTADKEYPLALFQLGLCFETGDGVARDLKQAEQWYLKAADADHVDAQDALAELYLPQDINKAIEWYEKAYYSGENFAASRLVTSLIRMKRVKRLISTALFSGPIAIKIVGPLTFSRKRQSPFPIRKMRTTPQADSP